MSETGDGFAWRIRLGDILTMGLVICACITMMFQAMGMFQSLTEKLSEKYAGLIERISKVEAKVDVLSSNNPAPVREPTPHRD